MDLEGTRRGSQSTTGSSEESNVQHPTPRESNGRSTKRRKTSRRPGILQGLASDNMLSPPRTQANEVSNELREATLIHVTRQARNGRSVKREKYDMKYHPLDRVTRPKQAAKRLGISVSPSKLDEGETDEESLPTSAKRDASESASEDSEEDVVISREPDVRAIRHSSRAAAQKFVNYSKKHHPQDFALPGFQHKARVRPQHQQRTKRSRQQRNHSGEESPGSIETRVDSRVDSEDAQPYVTPPDKHVRELQAVAVSQAEQSRIQDLNGSNLEMHATKGANEDAVSTASTTDEDPVDDLNRAGDLRSSQNRDDDLLDEDFGQSENGLYFVDFEGDTPDIWDKRAGHDAYPSFRAINSMTSLSHHLERDLDGIGLQVDGSDDLTDVPRAAVAHRRLGLSTQDSGVGSLLSLVA